MKNREIYLSALNLLAQSTESEGNEDYEERAPYILATFCNEVCEIDRLLRKFKGIDSAEELTEVILSLDEDFPLLDRFVSVASKYLAAMLVIDEDEALYEKLYDMYCDGISVIREEIPCIVERIVDKYL